MSDDKNLKTWISDKLMSILGYSQPTLVQFVIRLAKEGSSPADVAEKLVEFDLPSSSETRAFAQEVFARVPRKSTGLNSYQREEKEAAMLARKQKTYQLLDADDDEDDIARNQVSPEKKEDTRKRHFRKKEENPKEEDEEEVPPVERKKRARRRHSEDEEDIESEEARIRDQEERHQLERNIRERDAAATRKLNEPKLTRKEEEEAIRRSNALEQEDREILRKVSRREYLKKREQKKLEEIRDDIEDEQYLFDGEKLTEAEKREMRYKKEIYELAMKHSEDVDNINEYRMPEAYDQDGVVNQEKRFAAALQRYRDSNVGDKMNPFAEQEAWEEHQIGKANLKFGSKNKKQTDDYQYVFEDQIDFIKASVIDGDKDEDLSSEPPGIPGEKKLVQKLK